MSGDPDKRFFLGFSQSSLRDKQSFEAGKALGFCKINHSPGNYNQFEVDDAKIKITVDGILEVKKWSRQPDK